MLNIHLRGVYQTHISLLSMTENGTFKPIIEINGVSGGEPAYLEVKKQYLPGEFVLRFDYKENATSTSYPSEKRLLIGSQDLGIWVNPKYCNNPDSTYFQPGELENSAYMTFSEESFRQKEKIALLQDFLMNYDDTKSKFYKQGISEYEKRRKSYNKWLTGKMETDRELFVSSLYGFQYTPPTSWEGTEKDRINSIISHYFDGIDLSDPSVIRTSQMTQWVDNYVNLHGQLASSVALRDSIIPEASRKAIDQAKKGHPEVYGWMVDYFYRGFEVNNIPAGMKVLEPYLNDPACLTSKRKEIERRLQGMETLIAGSKVPDIELKDSEGKIFSLFASASTAQYVLILFWSADCIHCREIVESLYPWQQDPLIKSQMSVVAISLDETESEAEAWRKTIADYPGWKHLRAEKGVRSKVAADYFILSTPQMILLDAGTKNIIGLPANLQEIKSIFQLETTTTNLELP